MARLLHWGQRMLRTFDVPISWGELIKRTYADFNKDNVLALAAQLAYYALLALVPALIFLVSLVGLFPVQVLDGMINSLQQVAPAEITTLVRQQIESISRGEPTGLLTFGFVAALWSSSAAIVAATDALNRAYDIEEGRPWWKVRLVAMGVTIALAVFIIVAFALVLAGPTIAEWLATRTGMGTVFEWSWKILQWPLVILLVSTAIGLVFYFGPDAEQDWEWITPGAVLATVLWLLASLGFKIYVANFGSYNETYGTLGGIIVLMLWFYVSGLAVLTGAEMNAEIEHASPHGKAPGEKVRGQKKKLGARAARAYAEQQARHRDQPVAPHRAPLPARRPGMVAAFGSTPARPSASGVLQGFAVFLATRIFRRKRISG